MDNYKKLRIISIILILFVILFSGTYAWYTWNSTTNTTVDFTINSSIQISVNDGTNITGKELYPVTDYTDETYAITKVITSQLLNSSTNSTFNLNLNIVTLSDNLKVSSFKWKLLKNNTSVSSGNFSGKSAGDTISLVTNQTASTTIDTYKLYIYLDGSVDNDISMTNGTYNFKITASGENATLSS